MFYFGSHSHMDWSWSYSDDVPIYWHFLFAVYFAVFFVIARFMLDRFVYSSVAIWLLGRGTARPMDKNTRKKITKCCESLWKISYYATVEALILTVTYNEPWLRDTKEYFKGWPNQELRHSLRLVYMCQCGFYLNSIIALRFWEIRRKDFFVMMSHHVVTVGLIALSYIARFFRVGAVVLTLHDVSDVFLESAKVFTYGGKEVAASVCFVLFAISWFILRLIFFPFWVIKASSYDICQHVELSNNFFTFLYYVFNSLLLMLLVFHIYWWTLICAMVKRELSNNRKAVQDIRSDSDDD